MFSFLFNWFLFLFWGVSLFFGVLNFLGFMFCCFLGKSRLESPNFWGFEGL